MDTEQHTDMPRTYVDNAMNQRLGRVGLPVGSAVHSSSSSSNFGSSFSSSGSHKTYVDNAFNQSLGRVGMEHGTAVHSRSSSSSASPNTCGSSFESHGLDFVTPSRHSSYDHSSSSSSGSHKTYVDNPLNRRLGRVGKEHGTAVHSRSSSSSASPNTCGSSIESHGLDFVTPSRHSSYDHSPSSSSGTRKTYVDNPINRRLGRVGMEHGTAVYSKNSSQNFTQASSKPKRVDANKEVNTSVSKDCQETLKHDAGKKKYVDNAFNRRHNRVGLPLGSAPVSKKTELYRDTPLNRELGRAGKPWGTHIVSNKKLAQLRKHLEDNFNEETPAELNDVSEDAASHVLEFLQREKEIQKLLEERAKIIWSPQNDNIDRECTDYADPCYQENASYSGDSYGHSESVTSSKQTLNHTLLEMKKKIKCTEIDFDKLQLREKIGHGGFGDVHMATLDDLVVAVKILKNQQVSKKRQQQFIHEMAVLQNLNHPNMISFIGVCTVIPNLAIVMEFMDMSLFDAIQIKQIDFTDAAKLEITCGVTKGMAYLHQQQIAHCDLKSHNVHLKNIPGSLQTDVDKPVCTKITDFGLSRMKSDMVTTSSCPVANIGTPIYSAPEILRGEMLDIDELMKADIYSMGLLIWELAVEEIPFEDLNYEQLKVQVGVKGFRPVISKNLRLNKRLHESLSRCWSMDPNKRPSAKEMNEVASTLTIHLEEREE